MELLEFINQYGLLVVICGILASIICGAIKVPIARKIKANAELTEKQVSDKIRNVCTLIVAILSVIFVATYHCVTTHSFDCLLDKKVYLEILSAFTFSKIAYALYEGCGKVSLKKFIHNLIQKIIDKKQSGEKVESVDIFLEEIEQFFINEMGLPLTTEQTLKLHDKFSEMKNKA